MFTADNTNTNFGGVLQRGTNNVHTRFQTHLGRILLGIDCGAHLLNNCLQTAPYKLPVDLDLILIYLFKYFYIQTVMVCLLYTSHKLLVRLMTSTSMYSTPWTWAHREKGLIIMCVTQILCYKINYFCGTKACCFVFSVLFDKIFL